MAGVNYVGFNYKVLSLVFSSSGEVSYVPSRVSESFFKLLSLKKLIEKKRFLYFFKELAFTKPFVYINTIPYMLIHQKKNSPVSNLEQYPLTGIKYTRSVGTKSHIIKLDTRTGLGIVKLSSGLKKVFSAFSLASEGVANMRVLKNRLNDTKSGN